MNFFILEKKESEFDRDIDEWFDTVSRNSRKWKRTKITKYLNGSKFSEKELNKVKSIVSKYEEPGYEEILNFIENISSNKYKKEIKMEGAIKEFFSVFNQAIEF